MAKYVPYPFSGSNRYFLEGREALDRLAASLYQGTMDTHQLEEKKRRETILGFWKAHGLPATKDAFGTSRATLYRWRANAAPQSRAHVNGYAPRNPDPRLAAEIIRWRSVPETCRLGKGKLLPLLERFCAEQSVPEALS